MFVSRPTREHLRNRIKAIKTELDKMTSRYGTWSVTHHCLPETRMELANQYYDLLRGLDKFEELANAIFDEVDKKELENFINYP